MSVISIVADEGFFPSFSARKTMILRKYWMNWVLSSSSACPLRLTPTYSKIRVLWTLKCIGSWYYVHLYLKCILLPTICMLRNPISKQKFFIHSLNCKNLHDVGNYNWMYFTINSFSCVLRLYSCKKSVQKSFQVFITLFSIKRLFGAGWYPVSRRARAWSP